MNQTRVLLLVTLMISATCAVACGDNAAGDGGGGGTGPGNGSTGGSPTGGSPTGGPASSSANGSGDVTTSTSVTNGTSTDSATVSADASSSTGVVACGAPGEACCAGDQCDDEATCTGGSCQLTCAACETACELGSCIDVKQVTAGYRFSCALLATGSIRCWGSNDAYELGDGTDVGRWQQMPLVPPIDDVVAIASAPTDSHSCALTSLGDVWCWGSNYLGQLGVAGHPSGPVEVAGLTQAVAEVKVGGEANQGYTCVRNVDGTVACWGKPGGHVPIPRASITNATALAVGGWHACAIVNGGQVSCWGLNTSGQLGNGTLDPVAGEVIVGGITTATSLALGRVHSCAVLADGTARCWGDNTVSQLGTGATESDIPTAAPVVGLGGVRSMAAGGGHTCALLLDGTAKCWGDNILGQLGINSFDGKFNTPQDVVGFTGGATIAAGSFHTCASDSAGRAFCWGYNQGNQLGSSGNSWSIPHLVEW